MNDKTHGKIDHLIEEASALPSADPGRQRLLAEIDAHGESARRVWLERSGSYEAIREQLSDVALPEHLVSSLLEIPASLPQTQSAHRGWLLRGSLVAAALVMLLLIAGIVQTLRTQHDPFDELAALMIADHSKHPELVVTSSTPEVIERELNEAGKMLVRVPSLGDEFTLLGGRLCKFDRAPLAYTRWQHNGLDHSLYQVERGQFPFPKEFAEREISVPARAGEQEAFRVLIWQENEFVYGLVCPHPPDDRS